MGNSLVSCFFDSQCSRKQLRLSLSCFLLHCVLTSQVAKSKNERSINISKSYNIISIVSLLLIRRLFTLHGVRELQFAN